MTNKEDKTYVGIITVTCTAPKDYRPRKHSYKVGYVTTTNTKKSREEAVALQVNQFKEMFAKEMPEVPLTVTGKIEIQEVAYLYVVKPTIGKVLDK